MKCKGYLFRIAISIFFLVVYIIRANAENYSILDFLYPVLLILAYVLYQFSNFHKYLKYYHYQNKFSNNDISFSSGLCMIEIFQIPQKTTTVTRGHMVNIVIPPRKVKCNYILTSNLLLIFCSISILILFKRVLNPIIVKLEGNNEYPININESRMISKDEISYEGDSLIAQLNKSIDGIKKIKVINFPLLTQDCIL